MQTAEQRKILIILHQANSVPGRVGPMLVERGFQLDIRRPPLGHPLPETLEEHYGVIMFGGPMSANDKDDYIKREIDWLAVPLKENKPFLGICLGAQMLVKQLGGTVAPNDDQFAEVGYYPIYPTQIGKELMNWPSHIYQWHREGFSLPSCCQLLARGDAYPNQAFKLGEHCFGVQFHAELTTWMMNRWTVKGAERMTMHGAQPRSDHFEGRIRYDRQVKQWLDDFLSLWTGTKIPNFSDPVTQNPCASRGAALHQG